NKFEDLLRHLHLLPGAEARRYRQRPQDKQAHNACGSLINPFSGANLDREGVARLIEQDIKSGGHTDKITPSASLLDLKHQGLIVRAHLLRIKILLVEPALDVGDESRTICRRAYVSSTL